MRAAGASHARDPRYERYRWQVFGITWLAYVGFYLTRKSFAVAKIQLAAADGMGLSTSTLSWIDAGYGAAYAIGQFVWGMCGDRVGTRRVVLAGQLCSVGTAVATGASSIVVAFGILLFMQGLCQSTGWAPLTKNIGNFFSRRERGRVMGVWCTNYALGGVLGSGLAGWAADEFGWRFAFWIPAAALLSIAVLFFLLQHNRPEDLGLPPIEGYHEGDDEPVPPAAQPAAIWSAVREVLRNPMVRLLCAVYFFLKPTRYLILFWSPFYVNQRLGTGAASSGLLGSMFELAGPVGVLFGGFMSDKVFQTRRMPISIIALVVVAGLLLFFNDLPETKWSLGLGFFAIGFLVYIPDSLISGTAPIDFGTRHGASAAAGFVNGSGSIGAIIGVSLPGLVGGLTEDGTDIWGPIFAGLAVSLMIAAAILAPSWNALPGRPRRNTT
jgi:OPA family glycerol-3-phosphate transporter-like MFS transporter